jgi:hypothetical protein
MSSWRFRWLAPGVPAGTNFENAFSFDVIQMQTFTGASGPPYNIVTEEQPFRPGSYLKTITVDDAQVFLTAIFMAGSSESLWKKLSPLPVLFNPTRTNNQGEYGGRLIVNNPNVKPSAGRYARSLNCVCLSGFKIDESTLYDNIVRANLEFYATYPYWESVHLSESITQLYGKNKKFFPLAPSVPGGVPWFGSAPGNYVEIPLVNNGDVPAYPTIEITGPCGAIRIFNQAFGGGEADFKLTANGGVSLTTNTQKLTIDMFNRTVRRNTQSNPNQINKLTYDSTFFPLKPGSNTIRIEVAGTTQPTTQAKINWRDTFSGVI